MTPSLRCRIRVALRALRGRPLGDEVPTAIVPTPEPEPTLDDLSRAALAFCRARIALSREHRLERDIADETDRDKACALFGQLQLLRKQSGGGDLGLYRALQATEAAFVAIDGKVDVPPPAPAAVVAAPEVVRVPAPDVSENLTALAVRVAETFRRMVTRPERREHPKLSDATIARFNINGGSTRWSPAAGLVILKNVKDGDDLAALKAEVENVERQYAEAERVGDAMRDAHLLACDDYLEASGARRLYQHTAARRSEIEASAAALEDGS